MIIIIIFAHSNPSNLGQPLGYERKVVSRYQLAIGKSKAFPPVRYKYRMAGMEYTHAKGALMFASVRLQYGIKDSLDLNPPQKQD